jgi:hypothetical protein
MSDEVVCDRCGKEGRRRMGKCCPEGWYYADIIVSGEEVIMYACSQPCALIEWREGPGKLDLLLPSEVVRQVIES